VQDTNIIKDKQQIPNKIWHCQKPI